MKPVNQLSQWGPVAVIVGGYLLGMYFQNRRIDDLRDTMNRRFDDFKDQMNKRFDDLRDLLQSEIKRVEERIERVEERLERLEHSIAP
jgi:archaellum component FlaC